jgi:predicted nucleic acid-binding Zn ribbon protein
MPFYTYRCKCGKEKEVMHSMSEVDNPSKKTLKEITCHKTVMSRVPQIPQLMGASGGTFKKEGELLKDKQKQRQKRSSLHFKNEILPTLSKSDQTYFKKRYDKGSKKDLSGDHEKIK